ncbi:MAG: ATP phosphoribosyltransferase regulatory subunit [Alphaproteobacteria bacterium]|nr:ATP phosphoribosyltransferase regulatory subunit [Alphaproteobacteria bacterium]
MTDKNITLLPSGFTDLLPPEAEREARAVHVLMSLFSAFGYERVKPPLAEFEDSLLAPGPGAALSAETFRLMDPLSHRMLAVRSDLTAQIARISTLRLADEERPLRLAYANDVLRTRGSQQRTERQFCKAGCEIIGGDGEDSTTEICVLALLGLERLGFAEVTLDLTVPRFADHLLAPLDLKDGARAEIRHALSHKDFGALKAFGSAMSSLFSPLTGKAGDAPALLEILRAMPLPPAARADAQRLEAVYERVRAAASDLGFSGVSVSIDPLETRGFDYQSGVAFGLYAPGAAGALGRGGGYDVRSCVDEALVERATGFTLYMDTVRKAMPPLPEERKILAVGPDAPWAEILALQAEGWIVRRALDGMEAPGCTHQYTAGTIETITSHSGKKS